MNPIPHPGPIPTASVFANGYLELVMLLAIVALLATYGTLLLATLRLTRLREWLFCPVRLRRVRVLFRLAPDGSRADVMRCSVFGRRPITCGKVCLHPAPRT